MSECRYFAIDNQINTAIINTLCLLKSKQLQYQLDCRLYDGRSKEIKLLKTLIYLYETLTAGSIQLKLSVTDLIMKIIQNVHFVMLCELGLSVELS
jgi:hypothetical protein